VVEDPDVLTITIRLNEGVMFHDGTELTSAVAKWNYDLAAPTGKLQFADAIKEFEIVDDYTYVLHLNYWHNQLLQSLAWVPIVLAGSLREERRAGLGFYESRRDRAVHSRGVQPRSISQVGEEP